MSPAPLSSPAEHRIHLHDGALPSSFFSGAHLVGPRHGALASFHGVVRDHHHGLCVTRLVYQCYRPMAERLLARFLGEAAGRHGGDLALLVAHACGALRPGDLAMCVHVASAHRAAAFAACRELVERIKADLPVWKDEQYADGTHAWQKGS